MRTAGAHLTYCTNIHPGESWDQVLENLRTHVLAVKSRVAPRAPFGVGLRLSARAAKTLCEPARLSELRDFLRQNDLYVFTINGFPYGPFHAEPVKAAVYRPDWTDEQRGRYTGNLIFLLAELLPADLAGSISTVPGGFKRDITHTDQVERIAHHLLQQACALNELARERGRHIALALEPEPCCLLETTSETVDFFETHLLSERARSWFAREAGVGLDEAEACIRRHIGVCLDTCHAAIEFEDPDETLDRLTSAGIQIPKIQLSAGLRLAAPSPDVLDALRAYDEPVYLHQVVARSEAGELSRFEDLPEALSSADARRAAEWRVHFHVPLYRAELGAFTNTQDFLARLLERQAKTPATTGLEVETYTWDVLPPSQRTEGVVASIARELEWVTERLSP